MLKCIRWQEKKRYRFSIYLKLYTGCKRGAWRCDCTDPGDSSCDGTVRSELRICHRAGGVGLRNTWEWNFGQFGDVALLSEANEVSFLFDIDTFEVCGGTLTVMTRELRGDAMLE